MVNNSRIRLMTKLAIYEKNNPKDIELCKYYKTDYVKLNIIKTIIYVTVGYAICLMLAGFYNVETLISEAVSMDYKSLGLKILGVYIVLQIVSVMINLIVTNESFTRSRKRLNKYYKKLKQLTKMYEEQDNIR